MRLLGKQFTKLKVELCLNLKLLKESALLVFLSCYPTIISKAEPM